MHRLCVFYCVEINYDHIRHTVSVFVDIWICWFMLQTRLQCNPQKTSMIQCNSTHFWSLCLTVFGKAFPLPNLYNTFLNRNTLLAVHYTHHTLCTHILLSLHSILIICYKTRTWYILYIYNYPNLATWSWTVLSAASLEKYRGSIILAWLGLYYYFWPQDAVINYMELKGKHAA